MLFVGDNTKQSPDDFLLSVIQWISYSPKKLSKDISNYPKWFSNHTNPYLYLLDLLSNGYVKKCAPGERLSQLKLVELKSILSSNGLKSNGNKDELISTIIHNCNIDTLAIDEALELTEAGKEYLLIQSEKTFANNLEVYKISEQEYYNQKQVMPNAPKEDILIELLNQKQMVPNDFYTLYVIQETLHDQLLKRGRKEDALQHALLLAYYSVCTDHDYSSHPLQFKEFQIRITNYIFELRDYYNPEMLNLCENIPLPHNYFPPDPSVFKSIVESIVN